MKRIEDWTSEELAAQCVFPRLDTDEYAQSESYRESIHELISMGVGGFCIFKGDTLKVGKLIEQLQAKAEIPLLFAADFENGLTMRLEDGTAFPHAMALGIAGETSTTREVAQAIALEAKDIGINWNLAPVADVFSNPKNPVINIRAFSSDFEKTAQHAEAFIEGTQQEKVIATAKHFPGHGDTDKDSHLELPTINKSLAEIFDGELVPFQRAIESGVKSIMTGHLLVNALDEKLPVSLSKKAVTDLLRKKLGYEGIIITDALDMKGLTNNWYDHHIARLAFEAGNDVLLMPIEPKAAIDMVSLIVENSAEFKEQIIDSVKRIYNAKRFCGIVPGFAKLRAGTNIFMKHLNLALKAALKGLVVDCPPEALPLDTSKQYASFAILQNDDDMQAASRFFTMLAQATENDCDYGFIDSQISEEDISEYLENISQAEFLIFPIFNRSRAYEPNAGLTESVMDIIKKLSNGRPAYILIFGNPHFEGVLPSDKVIYAFSDSFASLAAVIMKLAGRELIEMN